MSIRRNYVKIEQVDIPYDFRSLYDSCFVLFVYEGTDWEHW